MTKSARILVAALGITLLGTLPALSGPRIKPHMPLPAQSTASAQSSASSIDALRARQESSTSRTFKQGLVSDVGLPPADSAAKSADGLSAASSSSVSHPH
jgi:hypothetical protein